MPFHYNQTQTKKVFCKDLCEYITIPEIIIKGGFKTKNGHIKYSETALRDAFEVKLQALLKK